MLLHKQIEKLRSKGFIKERFNTILLLQAKGLKPKKIADKTNLSLKTVNKYLLYYEYYNSSHDYVSVNSKQESYYKNEWQYGSIPTYNFEELSKEEKEFYINNLKTFN